jgi:hypothetical protein
MQLQEDLRTRAIVLRTEGREADAALREGAADLIEVGGENLFEAWSAMSLIHEALSNFGPVGTLPSEEAINAERGPSFSGYAEAFIEAIARVSRT